MVDFGWSPATSDAHRRLTVDGRDYDVFAFRSPEGVVGLRVTGWDAGYVVTELVGEIPAADAFDVGNLIASALGGFRGPPPGAPRDWGESGDASGYDGTGILEDLDGPGCRVQRAPNSGKPWEPHDLELLLTRFREGASVKTLTAELGRTEAGVRSRLQLLGVTRPIPPPGPATAGGSAAGPAGGPAVAGGPT